MIDSIDLDDGMVPNSLQKTGFYFKSKKHICKNYLIIPKIKEKDHNCLVKIYEIGALQEDKEEMKIKNGKKISIRECDLFLEIDLWNKYYFPKFRKNYQWYYNESCKNNKWMFDEHGNLDEIMSMAEVMKYAIKLGLKTANINLY